jgi:beta-lactam-binding protein with PASTA domain
MARIMHLQLYMKADKKGVITMKRFLAAAMLALAVAFTGVGAFAATQQQVTKQVAAASELKGQITRIEGHTLTIKDAAGKNHHVKATTTEMTGLKAGDRVDVMVEHGKAMSIQKTAYTAPAPAAPKR